MAPYALEEPFQVFQIVISTIFWEQLKRYWTWMFFGPIFINNEEFNCNKQDVRVNITHSNGWGFTLINQMRWFL